MKSRSSIWATGAALFTAILSSACCWLPLILLAFGASAAGVGSFFEAYRPYLLGATTLLLGGAFYLIYFRKRSCDKGECAAPNPRLESLNKVLLWGAAVLVLGFALFPNYVGTLLGSSHPESEVIDKRGLIEFVVELEGMTCEACAVHNQEVLKKLPEVRSAVVSYEENKATIIAEKSLTKEVVRRSVEEAGYRSINIQKIEH